jgi:hypothetical protein
MHAVVWPINPTHKLTRSAAPRFQAVTRTHTPPGEKKPGLEIDLSGPGLRSRSLGPPDLRPDLTRVFSGTPDLRPDLTWGCAETPNLQVRSRSQVQVSGHDTCERLQGFLPQPDEFYFTTDEKKILENCRCIVPNFINDKFI